MLSRYKIPWYQRIPRGDPVLTGRRIDTRKHRNNIFSPSREMVVEYLHKPTDQTWENYGREYNLLLEQRFRTRRSEFDALAKLAMNTDVFLGCNCPTKKNPDAYRCHTVLALQFTKRKYP